MVGVANICLCFLYAYTCVCVALCGCMLQVCVLQCCVGTQLIWYNASLLTSERTWSVSAMLQIQGWMITYTIWRLYARPAVVGVGGQVGVCVWAYGWVTTLPSWAKNGTNGNLSDCWDTLFNVLLGWIRDFWEWIAWQPNMTQWIWLHHITKNQVYILIISISHILENYPKSLIIDLMFCQKLAIFAMSSKH